MTTHRAQLEVGPYSVTGVSTGGLATSVRVDELHVVFDMGICLDGHVRMPNLLLTHGHPDHVGAIPAWLGQRQLLHMAPPRILAHPSLHPALIQALDAFGQLQGHPIPHELVATPHGTDVPLKGDHFVRTFASPHVVPTTGHVIYERRRKLNPIHAGKPGPEIAELRRSGDPDVLIETEIPLFCYPGDSLIDVVEREEAVRKCQVLMLECTFLDDWKGPDQAREGGHIHLSQIAERAELFENDHVILMHFSQAFSSEQVHALVHAALPESLASRVHLLTGLRGLR